MTMRKPILKVLLIAAVAAVLLPALLSACPLCKDAVPSNAVAGTSVWRGMYWSILLMIAVPFSAVATVTIAILRARKKQARGLSAPPPPLPFPESRGART
jgi:hypothetical protein